MVRELSSELYMTTGAVDDILNKLVNKVKEHLMEGDIVRLKNICSIRLVSCPEREVYNYSVNKRIHLPSRRRIRVATAKRLNDELKRESR